MKKGDNVRLRDDGRYEARYTKGRNENGKIIYGYCYGHTEQEAIEKRADQISRMNRGRRLNLIILGAGSHGADVADIARGLHCFEQVSFLDDTSKRLSEGERADRKIIGMWSDAERFLQDYPTAIVAVGDEALRQIWTTKLEMMGFIIPTLVHPSAYVPEDTVIGHGTVICARATISFGVRIGRGCIVGTGSTVPRKTDIPDWAYFDFDRITHHKEKYDV